MRPITLEQFIADAQRRFPDMYDYSLITEWDLTVELAKKQILLICTKHGQLPKTISAADFRSGKTKCPGCRIVPRVGSKDPPPDYIVNRVWRNTIDYTKYVKNDIKVPSIYICKTHNNLEFTQLRNKHEQGHLGCPKCIADNTVPEDHWCLLSVVFPELYTRLVKTVRSHNVHHSWNKCALQWICDKNPNHEIWCKPMNCVPNLPICYDCLFDTPLTTHSPNLVPEWDTARNVEVDINTVLAGDETPRFWICSKLGHKYIRSIYDRCIDGMSCNVCNGSKLNSANRLFNHNPELKNEWDPDNTLDPELLTYGTKRPAKWICAKGHKWSIPIANRTIKGSGCPFCAATCTGWSPISIEWMEELMRTDSTIKIQHMLNGGEVYIPGTMKTVDGYDHDNKTMYEFHGDYWHGNLTKYKPDGVNSNNKLTFGELHRRTMAKHELILSLGYKLVFIWESDYKAQSRNNPLLSESELATKYKLDSQEYKAERAAGKAISAAAAAADPVISTTPQPSKVAAKKKGGKRGPRAKPKIIPDEYDTYDIGKKE